jgi:hypothetical protein
MMARLRLIGIAALLVAALIATAGQAFAQAPTVTGISPNSGSTAGDGIFSVTTITGTNFTGATLVTIGGSPASFSVIDDKTISVKVPPGIAGVADVVVFTPAGNSGASGQSLYTYFAGSPSVTSVGPAFGATTGGDTINIIGSNFIPGTGPDHVTPATSVKIGGVAATNVNVTSASSLTATTPPGVAGNQPVVVTTAGGSGGGANFLYIAPATPVITSVVNNTKNQSYSGTAAGTTQGGEQITISGINFVGVSQVMFDNIPVTFTVNSPGSISTTTPAHPVPGAVNLSVTVAAASPSTGTATFTYLAPAPVVSSISPNSGSTARQPPQH